MLKKMLSILYLVFVIALVLEMGTRGAGLKPGYVENYSGLKMEDLLETYNLYKSDEAGIYSINSSLLDSLKKIDRKEYPSFVYQESVIEIIDEFSSLEYLKAKDTTVFANYLSNNTDSCIGDILKTYISKPFNSEGFKSIPFKKHPCNNKKVLLLGDSFVYGLAASPSYNSFADLLIAKGYIVYNTGICGADPAQYAAILEKYLVKLEPDVVILNFYQGNDFMLFPREAKTNEPFEHLTNIGFIESAPLGHYLNVQESYQFYKNLASVPTSSRFYSLCKKSSAFSWIYSLLVKTGIVYHDQHQKYYGLRDAISKEEMSLNTKVHIDKMNTLAKENEIPFINVIIPVKPEFKYSDKNYNPYFIDAEALDISFANWEYHYPKILDVKDYEEDGGHFNNKGSEKYAEYLDQLIKNKLEN
jgi:lysophospholipase L1-like esterase